ncbi:MAG: nitroreductase [Pseudomonadota bacterium]
MENPRRSIRGYLPEPVPRNTIEDVLRTARAAPSGANLQPGRFHVLTGKPLADLCSALLDASESGRPQVEEYSYFPKPMPPHLKVRQRDAGYALYTALGINRRDLEGRRHQFARNYRFFDAPVGIVVTIERQMGKGCFMDLGMALYGLIAAATDRGLSTCGIGALANHGDVVAECLRLAENELVVCGVALGYADPDHPANATRTSRLQLEDYTAFYGFEDPAPRRPEPQS